MSDSVTHITDANFQTEVLENQGPVLVDAYAEWCGPCKALSPIIDSIGEELEGQAKVTKIDIDQNPEVASKFGITSIPTVLIFDQGELKETLVGLRPKGDYVAALGA